MPQNDHTDRFGRLPSPDAHAHGRQDTAKPSGRYHWAGGAFLTSHLRSFAAHTYGVIQHIYGVMRRRVAIFVRGYLA